jgi:hypothetical protein
MSLPIFQNTDLNKKPVSPCIYKEISHFGVQRDEEGVLWSEGLRLSSQSILEQPLKQWEDSKRK